MQSRTIENPFPNPKDVNEEKMELIKKLIENRFKEKGKIEFHDMMKFFELSIENKDTESALISAYFCTNALISNQYEKYDDKMATIREMSQTIGNMLDD